MVTWGFWLKMLMDRISVPTTGYDGLAGISLRLWLSLSLSLLIWHF